MDTLLKAAAVGVIASILVLLIKKSNPEHGVLLALSAAGAIIYLALPLVGETVEFIRTTAEDCGVSAALYLPVIKCAGVALTGKTAADICRDAGHSASASAIEFTSAAAGLYISIPLLKSAAELIASLV